MAPGLYGPNHQHFFCVRMDMAVDGPNNTVVEVDSEHVPIGPGNETGNAWRTVRNVLETEGQAQRLIDPLKGRFWRIESDKTSALGDPTSYKLMPGENVAPMYGPDADYAGRAGFTSAHLWVTKFDADERFGAGEYPNQHPGGTGLPAFAASDEAIVDEDIVVLVRLRRPPRRRGRRTGRSCRWPTSASSSSPRASSTATPRWTCRRARSTAATIRPDPQEGSSISGVLLA